MITVYINGQAVTKDKMKDYEITFDKASGNFTGLQEKERDGGD